MQVDHDTAQTLATLTAIALTLLLAAERGRAQPADGTAPAAASSQAHHPGIPDHAASSAPSAGARSHGGEEPDAAGATEGATESGDHENAAADYDAGGAGPIAGVAAHPAGDGRGADDESADLPALLGPEFRIVLGPDTEADRAIYEDVRSELFWSPFVDADTITVAVNGGVVTLTGTVDSARERRAAAANARDAGAHTVRNDLTVERKRIR